MMKLRLLPDLRRPAGLLFLSALLAAPVDAKEIDFRPGPSNGYLKALDFDAASVQAEVDAALEAGEFGRAHLWLQHLALLTPDAPEHFLQQIETYRGMGAPVAAAEVAFEALTRFPVDSRGPSFRLLLADALLQSGATLPAWHQFSRLAMDEADHGSLRESIRLGQLNAILQLLDRTGSAELQAEVELMRKGELEITPLAATFFVLQEPRWGSTYPDAVLTALEAYPDNSDLAIAFIMANRPTDRFLEHGERVKALLQTGAIQRLPENQRRYLERQVALAESRSTHFMGRYGGMGYRPPMDDDIVEMPSIELVAGLESRATAILAAIDALRPSLGPAIEKFTTDSAGIDQQLRSWEGGELPAIVAFDAFAESIVRLGRREAMLLERSHAARDDFDQLEEEIDFFKDEAKSFEGYRESEPWKRLVALEARLRVANEGTFNALRGLAYNQNKLADRYFGRWFELRLDLLPLRLAEAAAERGAHQETLLGTAWCLLSGLDRPRVWELREAAALALGEPLIALHAASGRLAAEGEAAEAPLLERLDGLLATSDQLAAEAEAAVEAGRLAEGLEKLARSLRHNPTQLSALRLQFKLSAEAGDVGGQAELIRFLHSLYENLPVPLPQALHIARQSGDEALLASLEHGRVPVPLPVVRTTDALWIPASGEARYGPQEAARTAPGQRVVFEHFCRLSALPAHGLLRFEGLNDGYGRIDMLHSEGEARPLRELLPEGRIRLIELKRLEFALLTETITLGDGTAILLDRSALAADLDFAGSLLARDSVYGWYQPYAYKRQSSLRTRGGSQTHLMNSSFKARFREAGGSLLAADSLFSIESATRFTAPSAWTWRDCNASWFLNQSDLVIEAPTTLDFAAVDLVALDPEGPAVKEGGSLELRFADVRAFGDGEPFAAYRESLADHLSWYHIPVSRREPAFEVDSVPALREAIAAARDGDWISVKAQTYQIDKPFIVTDKAIGIIRSAQSEPGSRLTFTWSIRDRLQLFIADRGLYLQMVEADLPNEAISVEIWQHQAGWWQKGDQGNAALHVTPKGAAIAVDCYFGMPAGDAAYPVRTYDGSFAWLRHTGGTGNFMAGADSEITLAGDYFSNYGYASGIYTGPGTFVLGNGPYRAPKDPAEVAPRVMIEEQQTRIKGHLLGVNTRFGGGDEQLKQRYAGMLEARPTRWEEARRDFLGAFARADTRASRQAAVSRFASAVRLADPQTEGDRAYFSETDDADHFIASTVFPRLDAALEDAGYLWASARIDQLVDIGPYVSDAAARQITAFKKVQLQRYTDRNFTDVDMDEALNFFVRHGPGTSYAGLVRELQLAGTPFSRIKARVAQQIKSDREAAAARAAALEHERFLRQQAEQRRLERARREAEQAAAAATPSWSDIFRSIGNSTSSSNYGAGSSSRSYNPSNAYDINNPYGNMGMRRYNQQLNRSIYGTRY